METNGGHVFPTDLGFNPKSIACLEWNPVGDEGEYFGNTYYQNCGYDAVGDMFRHILPDLDRDPNENNKGILNQRNYEWQKMGTLEQFSQKEFVDED